MKDYNHRMMPDGTGVGELDIRYRIILNMELAHFNLRNLALEVIRSIHPPTLCYAPTAVAFFSDNFFSPQTIWKIIYLIR